MICVYQIERGSAKIIVDGIGVPRVPNRGRKKSECRMSKKNQTFGVRKGNKVGEERRWMGRKRENASMWDGLV